MQSAIYRSPGDIGVEERPVPTPGPGDVLVEVAYCGICGSDLHIMIEGWGKPGIVGGHEYTGIVAAVGEGVTSVGPGDAVVCGPSPRCGECRRCREGKPSQCERRPAPVDGDTGGGFARYVSPTPDRCCACPRGCPPGWPPWPSPWPWRCTASPARAWSPVTRPWSSAPGPSARSPSRPWSPMDMGPVVVVEPGERRRRLAPIWVRPRCSTRPTSRPIPPWEPERQSPRAVDVVFECSGKKAAMECGFYQLRRGGHLVLVGAGIEAPSFDPNRLILNELTVTGSFVYDADGFERALELLGSGRLPVDVLIDPDDVIARGPRRGHAAAWPRERIAGKVMVVPGGAAGAQSGAEGRLMAHPYYPSGNPRFNHVALSVPSDLLDETNRADICRFWGQVLGFDEMPTMTLDRKRLILSCVHWDQFIFLIAEDDPMRCPRMDHFGFAVGTLDELVAARDRAVEFRQAGPPCGSHRSRRGRPGADQDPLDLRRLPAPDAVRAPVLGVRALLSRRAVSPPRTPRVRGRAPVSEVSSNLRRRAMRVVSDSPSPSTRYMRWLAGVVRPGRGPASVS